MSRPKASLRRRLRVVGAGFVCGGAFIAVLALIIGWSPGGAEVMRAGVIGGSVPIGIGLVLILVAAFLRR